MTMTYEIVSNDLKFWYYVLVSSL